MPVTPGVILTGTLADLFGSALTKGTLVFTLCGYGSSLPRISGTALIAQTAPKKKAVDGAGAFSITLWGNHVILPPLTYYTVQLLDDNGNVIQTSAYQFLANGTFDLSTVVPYSIVPYVPPVPPAPQPGTLNVVVAFLFNAVFNALNTAGIISFEMTLTGNLTVPTLINVTAGQLITFMFIQDGTGGRVVTWPGNVLGGPVVDPTPGAISIQMYLVRSTGNLYPVGPMIVI